MAPLWAALMLAAAGCVPRAGAPAPDGPGRATDQVTVEVSGDPPPRPGAGFDPPPPLGDPPAPDPGADGLAYLRAVYPPLRDAWRAFLEDCRLRLPPDHELNNERLAVSVELVVDRQGRLIKAEIASPSGTPSFDRAALEVVRDAAPFSPPAVDVVSDDGRVHLTWLFARDRRQAGLATAELHRVRWSPDRAVPKLLAAGRVGAAARRVADEAGAPSGDPRPERVKLAHLFRAVAVSAIREALAAEDGDVKRRAVRVVGEGKLAKLAGELRRLAEGAADLELRRAAVTALGTLGDRGAIPLLRRVLADSGAAPEDRAAAAAALAALGERREVLAAVDAGLASANRAARWAALAIATQVPAPKAVPRLAELLEGRSGSAREERQVAAAALGAAAGAGEERAMRPLLAGLEVRDAAVRAACADALAAAAGAGAGGRKAFWKVVERLDDRDERVRAGAVLAAARLQPRRFGRQLRRLRRESSAQVLAALAEALEKVPGEASLRRLVGLAGHDSPRVRRAAAAALGRRREPEAQRALVRLAGDPDLEVRRLVLLAARDVELLTRHLEDESPGLRAAALSALVRMRGRRALLAEAAGMLAAAEPASAARVSLARAWLAP